MTNEMTEPLCMKRHFDDIYYGEFTEIKYRWVERDEECCDGCMFKKNFCIAPDNFDSCFKDIDGERVKGIFEAT